MDDDDTAADECPYSPPTSLHIMQFYCTPLHSAPAVCDTLTQRGLTVILAVGRLGTDEQISGTLWYRGKR